MPKLFYGKIIKSKNLNQFKDHYVKAPEDWFCGLSKGDYVFIGCSGIIALWKANKKEECEDGEIKFYFDVIDKATNLDTKKFRNLKGLIITPQLVSIQRQSSSGFLELRLEEHFKIADFTEQSFYSDEKNFRKIKIYSNKESVVDNSEDIQLYLEGEVLCLYKASFISNELYNDFSDYRTKANGDHRYKDKTFNIITDAINKSKQELNYEDLSIADLYDAFFCEYKPKNEKTSKDKFCTIDENTNKLKELLTANKNLILHGAPGTGKTYEAYDLAAQMICGCSFEEVSRDETRNLKKKFDKQTVFVQFHPSYDYTDFVEGLRPIEGNVKGEIGFERKPGIFMEFCINALKGNSNEPYIFIIDEINRGEISKIFGELFFLIDPDYRGKKWKVRTQYSNMLKVQNDFDKVLGINTNFGNFFVPENVYIIGTMNDIDRSVDNMDFAMRRRFTFVELKANECIGMLKNIPCNNNDVISVAEIKAKMDCINNTIYDEKTKKGLPGLSSSYHIGGSYFSKLENYQKKTKDQAFEALWDNHLEPLLSDYLRGLPNLREELDEIKNNYFTAGLSK